MWVGGPADWDSTTVDWDWLSSVVAHRQAALSSPEEGTVSQWDV